MATARTCPTDAQRERIAPLAPGEAGDPGATGRDDRPFAEAVLWIARTGAPWRDLPPELGGRNSARRRSTRWSEEGAWGRLSAAAAADPDLGYVIVDATIARAHQHGAGARGGPRLGPSVAPAAASRPSSIRPATRSATPRASG